MHIRSSLKHTRGLLGLILAVVAGPAQSADLTTFKLYGKWATASGTNARMGYFGQTGHPVGCGEKWAVIGAPSAMEVQGKTGAAQVFNAQTGARVRALLPPSTAPATACFGAACAVSGNLALVGAPDWSKTSPGAVHVFDLTNGNLLRTLTSTDGAAGDFFGCSIAIDGSRALIGAWGDESNRGAAYLFDVTNGTQFGKLTHTNGMTGDYFGISCALDGDLALVGAAGVDSGKGAGYLFDLTTETELNKEQPMGLVAGAYCGWQAALHQGHVILSIPLYDNGLGMIYSRALGSTGYHLYVASDGVAGDHLGLSMSASGGIVLAGAPEHDSDRGQVYAFDLNSPATTEFRKIVAPDPVPGANFGLSLATHCGTLVAAAPNDSTLAVKTGAGYAFRTITKAMPLTKITAKGDSAPGAAGVNFNLFSEVGINRDDQVAMAASLTGPESNKGKDTGAWTSVGMSQALDLSLKSRTDDGGVTIDSVSQALTNYDARAIFRAKLKGTGVTPMNNQAIYTDNGSTVTRTFRTGTFVTQFPSVGSGAGAVPSSILQVSASRVNPLMAFTCNLQQGVNGTTAASDSGLVMHFFTNNSYSAMREGAAAGATGLTYGQFTGRLAYLDNYAVYSTAVLGAPTTNAAIFAKMFGSNELKVVRKGDTPVGHDGAAMNGLAFTSLIGESSDDSERVAYRAIISGPGVSSTNNEGIWSWLSGTQKLIFRKGEDLGMTVTGFNGTASLAGLKIAKFNAFWPSWDQLITLVQLSGPGVSSANDQALVLFENIGTTNSVRLLMREGQAAHGCAGTTIGTINRVEVEAYHGNYLVLTTLKGAAKGTELALYQGSSHTQSDSRRQPMMVLRKGQLYDNQPGRLKTLALPGNNINAAGAGALGLRNAISEQTGSTPGKVVLPIEFENGVKQIMTGSL